MSQTAPSLGQEGICQNTGDVCRCVCFCSSYTCGDLFFIFFWKIAFVVRTRGQLIIKHQFLKQLIFSLKRETKPTNQRNFLTVSKQKKILKIKSIGPRPPPRARECIISV